MDCQGAPLAIKGEWDFPKGGIKPDETNPAKAILRELKEETGSIQYRIISQFNDKLCFPFPLAVRKRSGFERQETTMFLVEYIGNRQDLQPQDEEIDKLQFFSRKEVVEKLCHTETRQFFQKYFPEEGRVLIS